MGGKALKKTKVVRVGLEILNKVKLDINFKVSNLFQIDYPIDNPDKLDFGDLDVLYVPNAKLKITMRDFIVQTFNPVEIVTNGDVMSFAYILDTGEYLQVDFIKCPNISMAKFYFSYGDLGNILGQITKYYGVRFGHFGLFLNVTKETCVNYGSVSDPDTLGSELNEQLYLSDNPITICNFFQWDYSAWGKFSTELEIFQWICSSPYFNPKIFDFLNHNCRHKIITRPMFNRYIQWIEQTKSLYSDIIEKKDRQSEAIEYFGIVDKLNQIIKLNQKKQIHKKKFNGKKILDLGLLDDEKKLGEFIKNFKIYIGNKYGIWEDWLDLVSFEQVDQEIILFNNNNNNI